MTILIKGVYYINPTTQDYIHFIRKLLCQLIFSCNSLIIMTNYTYKDCCKDYLKYYLMSVSKDSIISGTAQPQITRQNLKDFQIVGNKSVYWPELDEDINLEGMFYDNHLCALSSSEDNVVYCGES